MLQYRTSGLLRLKPIFDTKVAILLTNNKRKCGLQEIEYQLQKSCCYKEFIERKSQIDHLRVKITLASYKSWHLRESCNSSVSVYNPMNHKIDRQSNCMKQNFKAALENQLEKKGSAT